MTSDASFWQALLTEERLCEETAAGRALVSEPMSLPKVDNVPPLEAAHLAVPTTPLALLEVDVVVEVLGDELVEHPAKANPAKSTTHTSLCCISSPVSSHLSSAIDIALLGLRQHDYRHRGRLGLQGPGSLVPTLPGSVAKKAEESIMTDYDRPSKPGARVGKGRMESFSDGVMGFAITLLVIDIAVRPPGSPTEQFFHAWPSYLAYVVSLNRPESSGDSLVWFSHAALG